MLVTALSLVGFTSASTAQTNARFDYWVLKLSWLPEYCDSHLSEDQCRIHDEDSPGFVVLGLAPQNERGDSPTRCGRRTHVDKDLIERLLPIMAAKDQIDRGWNEYGNCSGLDPRSYFDQVERARRKLEIPAAYESAKASAVTTRSALLQALHETNPQFETESFALRCSGNWLREVNVCYDNAMNPRACIGDVPNNCPDTIKVRAGR